MPPITPTSPEPPSGGKEPPGAPESTPPATPRPWPGLDPLGLTQAIGGIAIGLIALFSSHDHITFAGRTLQVEQQWGIPFIAASVATVVVDAQLATRSRLRAARERQVGRDRADQDRDRAAEARERQRKSFERLGQAALLSGRVQLDPNPTNRARFQFFLTLLAQSSLEEPDA
ncbi:MAG: hypothetical protein ACK4ZO_10400 [Cyanobacteriota bacterium]